MHLAFVTDVKDFLIKSGTITGRSRRRRQKGKWRLNEWELMIPSVVAIDSTRAEDVRKELALFLFLFFFFSFGLLLYFLELEQWEPCRIGDFSKVAKCGVTCADCSGRKPA